MKLSDFVEVTEIQKGWSADKKYCVKDENGKKYMFRLSANEQYDRKKAEFERMQKVQSLGVSMCEPIEFGTCEDGVYMVQSWIEGVDARVLLPAMTEMQAYDLGVEAGGILKKIHTIPAPEEIEDWETFFNRKMDRKIEMYKNCPLKYENGEVFIEHIEANRHLLKNRPMTYQHGDFHDGNLMIDTDGHIVVVDFDREDYGDPWEEFNRIVWCVQSSPKFATGMVDGYFDGNVPMEFWKLLALYISSNSLSSLPWAIPFGQEEIDVMTTQAEDILSWYGNMRNVVPSWYEK